jgi:hypothetical protein
MISDIFCKVDFSSLFFFFQASNCCGRMARSSYMFSSCGLSLSTCTMIYGKLHTKIKSTQTLDYNRFMVKRARRCPCSRLINTSNIGTNIIYIPIHSRYYIKLIMLEYTHKRKDQAHTNTSDNKVYLLIKLTHNDTQLSHLFRVNICIHTCIQ